MKPCGIKGVKRIGRHFVYNLNGIWGVPRDWEALGSLVRLSRWAFWVITTNLVQLILIKGSCSSVSRKTNDFGVKTVGVVSISPVSFFKLTLRTSQSPHDNRTRSMLSHLADKFEKASCTQSEGAVLFLIQHYMSKIILGLNWEKSISTFWQHRRVMMNGMDIIHIMPNPTKKGKLRATLEISSHEVYVFSLFSRHPLFFVEHRTLFMRVSHIH